MHRAVTLGLTLFTLLAAAPATFAQNTGQGANGGGTQSTSFVHMFLWSDDLVGLAIIYLLLLMSVVGIGFIILLLFQYRRAASCRRIPAKPLKA